MRHVSWRVIQAHGMSNMQLLVVLTGWTRRLELKLGGSLLASEVGGGSRAVWQLSRRLELTLSRPSSSRLARRLNDGGED